MDIINSLLSLLMALLAILIFIPLFNYISQYIIDFYICENYIYARICYFINMRFIKINEIASARILTNLQDKLYNILNPISIRFITRFRGNVAIVLIVKKTGLLKYYVLTPKNAKSFIEEIQQHLITSNE